MNTATASPSVTTGDARTLGRSAPPWVGPAVFALAVSAVIAPKFVQLVQRWRVDPNYNHGFLVLPIAAYLGVRAFRQGAPAGSPHGVRHFHRGVEVDERERAIPGHFTGP